MNKIQDADFMVQFPPALKKDKSMLALGRIIAEELHITAHETRKNIIYANIEELSETWLDVLAYDLHVDWYDYDYPIEIKRAVIKDSIRIHQKLGTKYAVETALRNVYKGASISEWFEYGGRPYYFKINIDTGGSSFSENAYADILNKVQFYKNLRSHCDGLYISLYGSSAQVRVEAGCGIGAVLKVKAKTTDSINVEETVHIMTAGAVGMVLKVKPFLKKVIQEQETINTLAQITQENKIKIKAKMPESLKGGAAVGTEARQKTGNILTVRGEK